MIEIIGLEGTAEFDAAQRIRQALIGLWPGIEATSANEELIRIAAGAKISGYRVSDIDIVVCGVFRASRRFVPKRALLDTEGQRIVNRPVSVPTLVVAVEVKDHESSGIRLIGDKIEVKYSRGGPIEWSKDNHFRTKQYYRVYRWDGAKSAITQAKDWTGYDVK